MTRKPIKIAYLSPSARMYGARQSLLQLSTRLNPELYHPIVVCPRRGDLEEVLRKAGIQTHILPLPPWGKGKSFIARIWRLQQLRRWVRSEGIELLHSNDFHANPYAVRASQSLGIPTVVHLRLTITKRQIRNYLLQQAARIICVSQGTARDLEGRSDLSDKIDVVYNGLDFETFGKHAVEFDFRERIGAKPNDFIMAQVGLISERKQQHLAIEAFNQLALSHPGLRLAIVGTVSPGSDDYLKRLEKSIRDSPTPERIHFVQFQENVAPVFAGIDLNLLLSNREGFGRVIIEAGCLGKPTVGSRVGGIPEVIEDGETGVLVECKDAETVANAIAVLLRDPAHYNKLAQNVRQFVQKRFSIETHVAQIEKIYQELLAESGS